MNRKERGQSLIEAVFAIGVIGLVLLGVASLLVRSINLRTRSQDRRVAMELGQLIVEEKVGWEKDDKIGFWEEANLNSIETDSRAGYEGYTYSVGYTIVGTSAQSPNCDITKNNCAKMVVRVVGAGMTGDVVYERFFTNK